MTDQLIIHIDPDPLLAVLGHNGENWIQGRWEDGGSGMCLHQAIRQCSPQPGDAYLIEQVAERNGWGTRWNDAYGRTWSDIRARINGGLNVTDADLADTFGPHWRYIVTIVRQAAQLTEEKAQALDAAWHAARHAAWHAAWDAVWDAARHAAWHAARHAVWDAARHAVWDAARHAAWHAAAGAAGAYVVRDLIGQHGFTQEHFDALAGPWESVMGKVVPCEWAPDHRGAAERGRGGAGRQAVLRAWRVVGHAGRAGRRSSAASRA